MEDKILHCQFPGARQRKTPVADLRTTLLVLRLRSRAPLAWHSPAAPSRYTRLISTCRSTCRMNMFLAGSRLNSTRNSTRAATKKWLVPVSCREVNAGDAGIPCRNPALNRDLQHKCQYKCHLYPHSCRAKPLYALNFNMSEHMSDEHVLP